MSDQRSRPLAASTPVPGEAGDGLFDDPWFQNTAPAAPQRVEAAPGRRTRRVPLVAGAVVLAVLGFAVTASLLLLFS